MITGVQSLAQMPVRLVESYRRLVLERSFRLLSWVSTCVIVRSR